MGRGTSTLTTRPRHTSRRSIFLSRSAGRSSTSQGRLLSKRRSRGAWPGGRNFGDAPAVIGNRRAAKRRARRKTEYENDAGDGGRGYGRPGGIRVLDTRQAGVRRSSGDAE